MTSKSRTTFEKLARERRLREKRDAKQEKKRVAAEERAARRAEAEQNPPA